MSNAADPILFGDVESIEALHARMERQLHELLDRLREVAGEFQTCLDAAKTAPTVDAIFRCRHEARVLVADCTSAGKLKSTMDVLRNADGPFSLAPVDAGFAITGPAGKVCELDDGAHALLFVAALNAKSKTGASDSVTATHGSATHIVLSTAGGGAELRT